MQAVTRLVRTIMKMTYLVRMFSPENVERFDKSLYVYLRAVSADVLLHVHVVDDLFGGEGGPGCALIQPGS